MRITQRTFTHVGELDCAFRTSIHEPIAALRMEFGRRNHFCQFFHIRWLDVHDIEALILNVEVP